MDKPLVSTLTFWGTALGLALASTPRGRRAGGLMLIVVGYGGLGVAWERLTGCDMRRLHSPPRPVAIGVLTHLPQAVLGTLLLSHD